MKKFCVTVNGNKYEVEIEETNSSDKNGINKSKNIKVSSSKEEITTPMPGTVLNIKVKRNERVKRGQVLLILEAMKMENEIMAPRDGVISDILVDDGTKVNTGDLILILE